MHSAVGRGDWHIMTYGHLYVTLSGSGTFFIIVQYKKKLIYLFHFYFQSNQPFNMWFIVFL